MDNLPTNEWQYIEFSDPTQIALRLIDSRVHQSKYVRKMEIYVFMTRDEKKPCISTNLRIIVLFLIMNESLQQASR